MMYCTGCGKQKDDREFWSARYNRHVARCLACRAEEKVVEQALKSQRLQRTPATIEADRRRPQIGARRLREDASNIRLIPDTRLAADVEFVVSQLVQR